LSAERLQKVLASAGIASRRDCEEFISAGRVSVNGKVVLVPGTRVDPEQDEIVVDGRPIGQISPRTYVMLNKPAGVVSTADDPQGRPTVVELVDLPQRLFSVGRLDYDSEGLLLMTDDGELTQRLTHPSYQIEKEYRALLDQAPSPDAIREWRSGVLMDGVPTAPAWVDVLERGDDGVWVRVVLHEGRKRQIREVAKQLGYEVLRLIRVREGPIVLGDLPAGEWRALTDEQVETLWSHVGGRESEPPADTAEGRSASRQEVAPPVDAASGADAPRRRRERPTAGGARRTVRPSAPETESEESVGGGDEPKAQPRAVRPRALGGDRPVPRRDTRSFEDRGPQDDAGPRRDQRPADDRGPRQNDRPFDNRGPRQNDRPVDNRGPRQNDRPVDNRGPRQNDRPFDNRGPRPDNRPVDNRGPRQNDRPFDNRGPRQNDRPFDNRGPRQNDRPFDNRGPRRDDRPFDNRGPRQNDRPSDNRGPRQNDRPFDNRGPRQNDRPFDNRGPRRDDRPFDNRGPRRDDTRGAPRDATNRERPRIEQPDVNANTRGESRPDPGNERLPDRNFREEKRGPGREWHERSEQEKRDRPAMRVSRPRFGARSGATKRVGFPFRPRPPRDDEDKR
jgi:23S rRNA pseudouridine2605 synthase